MLCPIGGAGRARAQQGNIPKKPLAIGSTTPSRTREVTGKAHVAMWVTRLLLSGGV